MAHLAINCPGRTSRIYEKRTSNGMENVYEIVLNSSELLWNPSEGSVNF